jgi:hypothetical protein
MSATRSLPDVAVSCAAYSHVANYSTMLDSTDTTQESMVTVGVGDERFRRSAGQSHLASYCGGHDASMQLTDGVRLPYGAEQDGDGFWCAHAQIRRGVAAFGEGTTREAALDDLRTALDLLLAWSGPARDLAEDRVLRRPGSP